MINNNKHALLSLSFGALSLPQTHLQGSLVLSGEGLALSTSRGLDHTDAEVGGGLSGLVHFSHQSLKAVVLVRVEQLVSC